MNAFEKLARQIRHSRYLAKSELLWASLRPLYEFVGKIKFKRLMNGTDPVLVLPGLRWVKEIYEPEVWAHVMSQIRPTDIIADIGAHIGLYTVAFAKRLDQSGKVYAFEPDPANFRILEEQVKLNKVGDRVSLMPVAISMTDGTADFSVGGASNDESHISFDLTAKVSSLKVGTRCLDTVFKDKRLDLLKIDVEGFEEFVLRSGINILSDGRRSPRCIYIEAHPYAWPKIGTSSQSLLILLKELGYRVSALNGREINAIEKWCEIVASKAR